jgi:hypothetical protein
MAVLEVCVVVHHSFFRFVSQYLCAGDAVARPIMPGAVGAQRPAAETGSMRYRANGVVENESTFELCHVHFGNRRGMVC